MMTHTYTVTGMTCTSCEASVKSRLLSVPGVTSAAVSKEHGTATVVMDKHVPLAELQKAVDPEASRYTISATRHNELAETAKSWFETYKPVLLIFTFITIATVLIEFADKPFDVMRWMQHFMAGFFLVFSFFKFLNLRGFAESYAMYDVIAKRFYGWGYVYAFIEFGLGIAYLINFEPLLINSITFVVMVVSSVGVLQSVLNKKRIQCACLGAVFNLPMSTVTIIEDVLMIAMSGAMILLMI